MSVKMRITSDNGILIVGNLEENKNKIELKENGDLYVDKVYLHLEGYESTDLVDMSRNLDGNKTFGDNDTIGDFLSWFFGIDKKQVVPNKVGFRNDKNIVCNDIKENQELE